MTGFILQLHKVVYVVWIEHQRLLADDIHAQPQAVTYERVVSIIRRADTHPVQRIIRPHPLGAKSVKLLVLSIEGTVRETAVQPAYAVKLVIRYNQLVARIGNRLDMSWSNVPRRPDQCKIQHIPNYYNQS